jgi:DNA ligase-1
MQKYKYYPYLKLNMQYKKLVEIYQKLEATSKRLEKTYYISELLKSTPKEEISKIVLLLQGRVFPQYDERILGVAARLIIKAINIATGIPIDILEREWGRAGDLGLVAENFIKKKKQSTLVQKDLTITKVFENLRKLAELEGKGTVNKKLSLIAELLITAKPIEARYIVRTVLGDLRVGIGSGSLRDAIVWSSFKDEIGLKYNEKEKSIEVKDREKYNEYLNSVQYAYDLTNDFSVVSELAKTKGLKGLAETGIEVGRPVKVLLALKENDIESALERVGKPAQIEYKYDGFRTIIHKKSNKIWIYTRRLENVTSQFPDLVATVKNKIKAESFIIDGEAVGYNPKTRKYLPFQNISQRIKRKYDIEEISRKFPVELNVFDILYYNDKNLLEQPLKKRRALIEKIVKETPKKIILAEKLVSSDKKEIEEFFKKAIEKGNEGLIFKKLDAPYKPGARVGYWVKLKPEGETLDLIVVGAEWGEGKRAKWLSSYDLACVDKKGNLLEIGKASTGLKEKEEQGLSFKDMTKELKPLVISQKGKKVTLKPKVVIEVAYEEIQKSPTYSSGYALRFPRIIRLRTMEKSPKDATTLDYIEYLYKQQRK